MFKDNDLKIRVAAARALWQLGDKQALNSLANSLLDDDWAIIKEIKASFNNIESNWLKLIKSTG